MNEIVFQANNIYKNFGSTIALSNVDLIVKRGEIRGFVGENGSGKSTMSSIASGIIKQTSGELYLHGKLYEPTSMVDALKKGVGMIVQESGTVAGLTIAENLFLGEENDFSISFFKNINFLSGMFIDKKTMNKKAQEILDEYKLDFRANTPIDYLDMQDRKLIEVLKVVMMEPDVLIIDETTTALSQRGRDIVYQIMEDFKLNNKSVLFISHDLSEIMDKCTDITVLRDGNIINSFKKDEFDEELIKMSMIGRELIGDYYPAFNREDNEGEPIIRIENLTDDYGMKNLSLTIKKGEVLGVGGMSHSGMHQLGRYIYGIDKPLEGKITYLPNDEEINSVSQAIKNNFGYVSKDRDNEALVLEASILDNIAISGLDKIQKGKLGLIFGSVENKYVQKQIDELSIKCRTKHQQVRYLSGGNKQKVVFGKWVGRDSQILILDCPTRGVDVGVKQAMYHLIHEMRMQGKTIIMISEELTELIGMANRIVIMKDQKIAKEFTNKEEITEYNLLQAMI